MWLNQDSRIRRSTYISIACKVGEVVDTGQDVMVSWTLRNNGLKFEGTILAALDYTIWLKVNTLMIASHGCNRALK